MATSRGKADECRHTCVSPQVYYILSRCSYLKDECPDKDKKGIKRLLNNGTYTAAFPLHDVRALCSSVSLKSLPSRNILSPRVQQKHEFPFKSLLDAVKPVVPCVRAVQILDPITGPQL